MKTKFKILAFTHLIILIVFCNIAQSYHTNWGHHGAWGGRYCPFQGSICFNMVSLGDATLADEGNLDMTVINNSQIHVVFHRYVDLSLQPDSLLPVDTNTALSREVSNSLGFDTVILVQGDYEVDYSTHQFGEATINAILIGPLTKLNLTCLVEGFYYPVTGNMVSDTVTVNLRSVNSPYQVVSSGKAKLNQNGNGQMYFSNVSSGVYYIQVIHRNSIETWSKSGGESFTNGGTTSYDFTNSIAQAFGNNMILKGSKFCIYGGDVNQNNFVDLSDVLQTYNNASNFTTGYVVTDLNGDNIADLSDILIAYNNSSKFVDSVKP